MVAGNFLIMDSDGNAVGRGEFSKIFTFPDMTAGSTTQWIGRLPAGKYQLILTYDLGAGKTIVQEKNLIVSS